MAAISESLVSIRIAGDQLDPSKITALLGVEPSVSYRKGEIQFTQGGKEILRRTGMWSLKATVRFPENIEAQVEELFAQLPSESSIWSNLSSEFEIDLFCGLFMNESNEGLSISSKLMRLLSERGIELGLDIYAPTVEESPSAQA